MYISDYEWDKMLADVYYCFLYEEAQLGKYDLGEKALAIREVGYQLMEKSVYREEEGYLAGLNLRWWKEDELGWHEPVPSPQWLLDVEKIERLLNEKNKT